jgi:hypothetical protein
VVNSSTPILVNSSTPFDRQATQQLDQGVEKRIIGSKHDGRPDHYGAGEGPANRVLSLSTRADVGRRRCCIGADP